MIKQFVFEKDTETDEFRLIFSNKLITASIKLSKEDKAELKKWIDKHLD